MDDRLKGKAALVTGASRGIGAATARALDAAGARVALAARSVDELRAVGAALSNDPVVLPCDLSGPAAVEALASRALEVLGAVDILVNNAGLAVRQPAAETDAALVDRVFAVNVRAPLLLIAALVPSMTERGQGCVINLSSVSALIGTPRRAVYAASKAALDAASRSLAVDLGPCGIRVNNVAPGVVDTALWAKNKAVPGVVEEIEQLTPLRRWGRSEDIADVIVFLASDAARFVTGVTISVDGGMAHALDLYGGAV